MKKGVFSSWFREFATIVLTQSVQAFLLAIVMSIIINSLSSSGGGQDNMNASALLAIITLSSFGKIEMLVKQIFGVTSGFGDPSLRNGAGITAGTMMAWRGGKRLLDNGKKFAEGHAMKVKARKNIEALSTSGGGELDANKGLINDEGTTGSGNLGANAGRQIEEQVVKLQTLGDIQELTTAIKNLTTATDSANKNTAQDKLKEYQDMYQQGKDKQKSAILESGGAVIGGATGMVMGLAKGEKVGEAILQGAGDGDFAGQAISDTTSNIRNYNVGKKELNDKIKGNIVSSNSKIEQFKKDAQENIAKGRVQDVDAYNKYIEDATKQYKENQASIIKDFSNNKRVSKTQLGARAQIGMINHDLKKVQKRIDKNSNAGNS